MQIKCEKCDEYILLNVFYVPQFSGAKVLCRYRYCAKHKADWISQNIFAANNDLSIVPRYPYVAVNQEDEHLIH